MYKNLNILLVFVLLMLYPLAIQATIFRNLTEKDGLSDLMVSALYKDSSGFIWLGTASSVERFDGTFLKHYPITGDNGKLKWVNVITETTDHKIIVGNDMGVWTVDNQNNRLVAFEPKAINCGVHALLSSGNRLFIGSEKGLFIYEAGRLRHLNLRPDLLLSAYNSIVALNLDERNETLWLLSRNCLYSMNLKSYKITAYPLRKEFLFRTMTRINHQLYLGTMEDGLLSFDCVTKKFKENIIDLGCKVIMSLSSDGKGLLYVGTDGNGVHFVSVKDMTIVRSLRYTPNTTTGICSNSVYSLMVDKERNIWIGYYMMGLEYSLYQSHLFTTYARPPYFDSFDVPIRAISISGSRKLLGTRNGLFYIDENKGLCKSFMSPLLRSNMILSICLYHGMYYIGTFSGGLSILDPKTLQLTGFKSADPVFKNGNVFRVMADKQNRLWLCTSNGLYCYQDSRLLYHYTTKNSRLPGDNVYDIYFDSTHKGWICTDNGLCIWDASTKGLRTDIFPQGFINKDKIRTVYEDSSHKLYFLPSKGDVLVADLNLSKFGRMTSNTLLEGKDVVFLTEDKEGWLWLGTTTGLYRYDKKDTVIPYTFADGIPSPTFMVCLPVVDSMGGIWMGNSKGLVYMSPKKENAKWPYPLAITDVLIDGQKSVSSQLTLDGGKYHLNLNSKQRNLTIHFSDFVYSDPQCQAYMYKMEGIDKEELPLLGKSEVTYYDLPSGTYTFRLYKMGKPEEETTLVITVAPSYQVGIWCVAFLLLAGGTIYFYRKQLKALITRQTNNDAPQTEKYKKYHISKEDCEALKKRLDDLMQKDRLFSNPTLKVGELAGLLGVSSNTLSYLFSQYLKESFYDYLNAYRVEEFKKLANEETGNRFTLVAMAESCGFNSRASFFRYFKKITGLTPNQYMQSIGKGNIK